MDQPEPPKPARWFYRTPTNEILGPYDLTEMAGYLATGDINSETPTHNDLDDQWLPFRARPEFTTAREMTPDLILRRLEVDDPEPVSFLTKVYYFFKTFFGILLYALTSRNRRFFDDDD